MNQINEGVRILVERMKTNPEEFHEGYGSKWARVVSMAVNAAWLTEEERKLLDDAANEVKRQIFTAEVLKTLTEGPVEQRLKGAIYPMGGMISATATDAIARSTGVAITGPNFAGATGAIAAVDYERR